MLHFYGECSYCIYCSSCITCCYCVCMYTEYSIIHVSVLYSSSAVTCQFQYKHYLLYMIAIPYTIMMMMMAKNCLYACMHEVKVHVNVNDWTYVPLIIAAWALIIPAPLHQ